jgi:phage-related protein
VFDTKNEGELSFYEEPYKIYDVKVSQPVDLKYIVFDNPAGGERIYKGTGTINFICYQPYAHTPKDIRNGKDGRFIQYYLSNQ